MIKLSKIRLFLILTFINIFNFNINCSQEIEQSNLNIEPAEELTSLPTVLKKIIISYLGLINYKQIKTIKDLDIEFNHRTRFIFSDLENPVLALTNSGRNFFYLFNINNSKNSKQRKIILQKFKSEHIQNFFSIDQNKIAIILNDGLNNRKLLFLDLNDFKLQYFNLPAFIKSFYSTNTKLAFFYNNFLKVYDINNLSNTKNTFENPMPAGLKNTISKCGKYLAIGNFSSNILISDFEKVICNLTENNNEYDSNSYFISHLFFSEDLKYLINLSRKNLYIWNIEDIKKPKLRKINLDFDDIKDAYLRDIYIFMSNKSSIKIFNIENFEIIEEIYIDNYCEIVKFIVSNNGKYLALLKKDNLTNKKAIDIFEINKKNK